METNAQDANLGPARIGERRHAFDYLLADLPAADLRQRANAFLAAAEHGELSLDGLFVARRSDKVVAAAWVQIKPGRVAELWPPRVDVSAPVSLADELIAAALAWSRRQDVVLAQALLSTDAAADAERLSAHGFVRLAELCYLVSLADSFPRSASSTVLQFEDCTMAGDQRLAQLVEQTYENTLDCPELNGVRDARDVLEGYRAAGDSTTKEWLFVRCEARDVGCLLLSHRLDQGETELVYMGLLPAARGRGWGLPILRHAQWRARMAGSARLVLAVDSRNEPALAVYAAAGFSMWDRRAVYLRIFREPSPA